MKIASVKFQIIFLKIILQIDFCTTSEYPLPVGIKFMLMLIRIDQLTVWTMNLMWWNGLTRTFPDILYINLYIRKYI